jgi:hypothetical protein
MNDYDKSFFFPYSQFSFFDGDVPLAPSYGIYISQLNVVHIAHIYNNVSDFNDLNTAFINY